MDAFRDESAATVRIERLEEELAETREELARVMAAMPENASAFARRLEEENEELRRDCARLRRKVERFRRLRGTLR